MNKILVLILSFAALFYPLGSSSASEPPRPNILYFYVDDMGWGSIGPNGQAERRAAGLPAVQTPNLDQLAAEGVNFTRAYGCTVCSPARSSQQTGFHQGHTFADRNDPDNAKKAIRQDDVTMGDVLLAADYVTGYWGKWGYGGSRDLQNPTIDNVQTLPTSHGYRQVLAELHHVRAHTFFQPTLWSAPVAGIQEAKGGLELVPNSMRNFMDPHRYPKQPSNHHHPEYPEIAYCDDAYAFAALDFVRVGAERYRSTKQPFFGLLAVQIPHAPFDEIATLPGWDAAYADDPHFEKLAPQSRQWAAMVTRIDAHFGNILTALNDPNGDGNTDDSVANETLVIFMSDNGGPGGKNNSEFDANGGLRGNKGSIFEGGIRVPTVMRWPAKIKAGTTIDIPIDVTDLLPTFCELAGSRTPPGLDGVSIAPLLTNEGQRRKRDFLIHEAGNSQSIIRGDYKLIRTSKSADKAKKGKAKKGGQSSTFVLYDLAKDHAEKTDISVENPEIVAELKGLMLGERVDEPRGFANTYHHWLGKSGTSLNDASSWSDYVSENEGIEYLKDNGPPRLSWTATVRNIDKSAKKAIAESDLEFLSLDLHGIGNIEVVLGKDVNLTGRNEIRVGGNGVLTVNGGTVSSLRWVDVKAAGTIQGTGKINATLYNEGEVSLAGIEPNGNAGFEIAGDYVESPEASIIVSLSPENTAKLSVGGTAKLAGMISIQQFLQKNSVPVGRKIRILSAASIEGRFAHENGVVISDSGQIFRIEYGDNSVHLIAISPAGTNVGS